MRPVGRPRKGCSYDPTTGWTAIPGQVQAAQRVNTGPRFVVRTAPPPVAAPNQAIAREMQLLHATWLRMRSLLPPDEQLSFGDPPIGEDAMEKMRDVLLPKGYTGTMEKFLHEAKSKIETKRRLEAEKKEMETRRQEEITNIRNNERIMREAAAAYAKQKAIEDQIRLEKQAQEEEERKQRETQAAREEERLRQLDMPRKTAISEHKLYGVPTYWIDANGCGGRVGFKRHREAEDVPVSSMLPSMIDEWRDEWRDDIRPVLDKYTAEMKNVQQVIANYKRCMNKSKYADQMQKGLEKRQAELKAIQSVITHFGERQQHLFRDQGYLK